MVPSDYSFEDYVRDFRRDYAPSELLQRRRAVEDVLQSIKKQNSRPARRWEAGVNELTDRSPEELHALGGYDKVRGFHLHHSAPPPQPTLAVTALPDSFDWRDRNVATAVKEQHTCQACWAFAAVQSIESALAIAGEPLEELSVEEVVSCTPNPEHCGGKGGCDGSTAEQAYNFSITNGLNTEAAWSYKWKPFAHHGCDDSLVSTPVVSVGGYTRLPPNDAQSLMVALVQEGPITVTVAANSWMLYDNGIWDGLDDLGCGWDLNHQVSLMGYGQENDNYWLVRNSWGSSFGEQGYIRILRAAQGQEEMCGEDASPKDGYCGNEGWCICPKSIHVCGMCGILGDSSYPTGVQRIPSLKSAAVV